jgi:tetratricopeptide (TPR) repeat protein
LPKPGWLAGALDKRYYEGVHAYLGGDYPAAQRAFQAALSSDPTVASAHFLAAMTGLKVDMPEPEVIAHLEAVVASDDVMPDRLQLKYMPPAVVQLSTRIGITKYVIAEASFDSVGATLMLAELYQEHERLSEAIGLIAQVHEADPSDAVIRLSLADLLLADGDHEGTLEATSEASNDSDIGVALLHLRAAALFGLGHQDGAFEAFKLALAKTASRDAELLKIVRYDRAIAYEAAGQAAKARADIEKLYANDPSFLDVAQRLAVYGG